MIKLDYSLMTENESNVLNFYLHEWWDSINEMVDYYLKNHKLTGEVWCNEMDYNAFRCYINRFLKTDLDCVDFINPEDHSDHHPADQSEDENEAER